MVFTKSKGEKPNCLNPIGILHLRHFAGLPTTPKKIILCCLKTCGDEVLLLYDVDKKHKILSDTM